MKFEKIVTAIWFEAGSYLNNDGSTTSFKQLGYETALVSISQNKKIIKTEMQGRDGTVKEYIGLDDYSINVVGRITGDNGVAPIQELIDLKAMLDAPIPIGVICPHLQNLGVHYLVVTGYELPQVEGGISYQNFSINFISDVPVELRINDNNMAV